MAAAWQLLEAHSGQSAGTAGPTSGIPGGRSCAVGPAAPTPLAPLFSDAGSGIHMLLSAIDRQQQQQQQEHHLHLQLHQLGLGQATQPQQQRMEIVVGGPAPAATLPGHQSLGDELAMTLDAVLEAAASHADVLPPPATPMAPVAAAAAAPQAAPAVGVVVTQPGPGQHTAQPTRAGHPLKLRLLAHWVEKQQQHQQEGGVGGGSRPSSPHSGSCAYRGGPELSLKPSGVAGSPTGESHAYPGAPCRSSSPSSPLFSAASMPGPPARRVPTLTPLPELLCAGIEGQVCFRPPQQHDQEQQQHEQEQQQEQAESAGESGEEDVILDRLPTFKGWEGANR